MKILFCSGIIAAITLVGAAVSAKEMGASEVKAVKDACLDYVEGFFESNDKRITRGVHPGLNKRNVSLNQMTRDELVDIATSRKWVKPSISVDVFDISGNIASAKIVSEYVDYALLVKTENGWQVVSVLWDYPK